MERREIIELLVKIVDLWNDYEAGHCKDEDKFDTIKEIMPDLNIIDDILKLEEDELDWTLWDCALTCSLLSRFIDDYGDVYTFANSYYSFLDKIGADRIIQKWNYYCDNGREPVFLSQEDKRSFYLKVVEIYDEIGCYKDEIKKYCAYINLLESREVFHELGDENKVMILRDICDFYKKKASNILDIIKDDFKGKALPDELNNEDFKGIIRKGIEAKLIEESSKGLKWNKTKVLLSYFAECISKRFGLSKGRDSKGDVMVSWKPFEVLFGVKDLKGAKQNWMRLNTQFTPNGHEEIDEIIE